MKKKRPIIGITMRIEFDTDRFYLARLYSEAVEAAGGVPLPGPSRIQDRLTILRL